MVSRNAIKCNVARPSPPSAHGYAARPLDQPGGEGLAARLEMVSYVSTGSQTAAPPPGMQQVIGQFGNPVGSYPAPYQPQGGVGFGNQLIFAQAQPPQQGIANT